MSHHSNAGSRPTSPSAFCDTQPPPWFEVMQKQIAELTTKVTYLEAENKINKNKIADLADRSMKDNLILNGIPETVGEDTESTVKTLINITMHTNENVEFQRVHRSGTGAYGGPRNIVAKFSNYKQKEKIRKCSNRLRGTPIGIQEQFSKETNSKRKIMTGLLKEARHEGKYAVLVHDYLIVENQKFKVNDEGVVIRDLSYNKPPSQRRTNNQSRRYLLDDPIPQQKQR